MNSNFRVKNADKLTDELKKTYSKMTFPGKGRKAYLSPTQLTMLKQIESVVCKELKDLNLQQRRPVIDKLYKDLKPHENRIKPYSAIDSIPQNFDYMARIKYWTRLRTYLENKKKSDKKEN